MNSRKYRTWLHIWCLELGPRHPSPSFSTLASHPFSPSVKLSGLCLNFFAGSCNISLNFISLMSQSDNSALRLMTVSETIPVTRTTTYGHWIVSYCAAKQWNSLPFHTRHLPTIESFKCALKTYLFLQYYFQQQSTQCE